MKVSGRYIFPNTTPERVWQVLLNPAYLGEAVPGCEKLEGVVYQRQCRLVVHRRIGHLAGRDYTVALTFRDHRPYERYAFDLVVSEAASSHNRLRGGGKIVLEREGGHTAVRYHLAAEPSGTLRDVGDLLLETLARAAVRQTFEALAEALAARANAPQPAVPASQERRPSLRRYLPQLFAGVAALVPVLVWWYRRR